MTISREIAQAIVDVDRPYGATAVVPLRQLCGDVFVDTAIALAKSKGDLGYFDQAVRQLAYEVINPTTPVETTIRKRSTTFKSSLVTHLGKQRSKHNG